MGGTTVTLFFAGPGCSSSCSKGAVGNGPFSDRGCFILPLCYSME